MTNSPFGKQSPPSNLSTFGDDGSDELDNAYNQKRPAGGSGGSERAAWVPRFQLPGDRTVPIIIHRAQVPNQVLYADGSIREVMATNLFFVSHYNANNNRFANCSAVPYQDTRPENAKRCTGCKKHSQQFQQDKAGKWSNVGPISKQQQRGFSITVLEPHARVPGDRKGPDGNPYMLWRSLMEMSRQEQVKYQSNAQKYLRYAWSLSAGSHYPALMGGGKVEEKVSIVHRIRQNCYSCGTVGSIRSIYWKCGACEAPLGPSEKEEMTIGQVKAHIRQNPRCDTCGVSFQEMNPVEEIECAECPKPERAGLYNSILHVRGTPSGAGATVDPRTGKPRRPVLVLTLDGWKPLRQEKLDLPAEAYEPIDLLRVFAPAPAALQLQVFGELAEGLSEGALATGTESYDDKGDDKGDDNIPY